MEKSSRSILYEGQTGRVCDKEDAIRRPKSAFPSLGQRRLIAEALPFVYSAVQYAVNLHDSFHMPLTEAYASAVAQFRSLRGEHHTARTVALMEAEALGVAFGPSTVELNFKAEEGALRSWTKKDEEDAAAQAARKRWRAVVEREGTWTRAQEYTRMWQEGVRPSYSAVVEQAVSSSSR